MTPSLRLALIKHERSALLTFLFQAGGNANVLGLQQQLDTIGQPASLDSVKTQLSWLEEQGLVSLDEDCAFAELTERGTDVACDRSIVPGIARGYLRLGG